MLNHSEIVVIDSNRGNIKVFSNGIFIICIERNSITFIGRVKKDHAKVL